MKRGRVFNTRPVLIDTDAMTLWGKLLSAGCFYRENAIFKLRFNIFFTGIAAQIKAAYKFSIATLLANDAAILFLSIFLMTFSLYAEHTIFEADVS